MTVRTFRPIGVATAVVLVLGLSAAPAPAARSSTTLGKPAASAVAGAATPYVPSHVRVKLRPGARWSSSASEFAGSGASAVNSALRAAGVRQVRSLFATAAARKGTPDLSGYYRLRVPASANAKALAATLRRLSAVEVAYPDPAPAPPPISPSFTGLQAYRGPAPSGIGAAAAKTWPGATGSFTKIYDVEYSWNTIHEDLGPTRAPGAVLAQGTPVDPFDDNNHGTAVLGQLVGTDNGIGVTGIVPGSPLRLVNAYSEEDGWNVGGAVHAAANNASAGDVILIEQQVYGPENELLPVEWVPDVYDAIRYAVSLGVHVVEAGANSGRSLDDAAYGSQFPAGKPNSGAIVVGAGSACEGAPARERLSFSNYGSRVDLQGWGECVTTTGYGDLYNGGPKSVYTQSFNGTSAASPVVAGALAAYSSAYQRLNGEAPSPAKARADLVATGVAQTAPQEGAIGPLPNLANALKRTDLRPPSPPEELAHTVSEPGAVVLTWLPSTDNVGVAKYKVYRAGPLEAGSTSPSELIATIGPNPQFTDTRVEPGQRYSYRLQAVDRSERVSPFSDVHTAGVPLLP